MRLKDKLAARRKQDPSGANTISVPIETGEDILELRVSRNDLSAALMKRQANLAKKWDASVLGPDDELTDDQRTEKSVDFADFSSAFIGQVVTAHRIYASDATPAQIQKVKWEAPPSAAEYEELPIDLFQTIVMKVSEALNPLAEKPANP